SGTAVCVGAGLRAHGGARMSRRTSSIRVTVCTLLLSVIALGAGLALADDADPGALGADAPAPPATPAPDEAPIDDGSPAAATTADPAPTDAPDPATRNDPSGTVSVGPGAAGPTAPTTTTATPTTPAATRTSGASDPVFEDRGRVVLRTANLSI